MIKVSYFMQRPSSQPPCNVITPIKKSRDAYKTKSFSRLPRVRGKKVIIVASKDDGTFFGSISLDTEK